MRSNADALCNNCGRSGQMIYIPNDEPTENYKPTIPCPSCGVINWNITRFPN